MQGHDPCHYRDPEVFCNGSQTVLLILASEMVTKDLVSFLAIYFSYFTRMDRHYFKTCKYFHHHQID